VPGSKHAKRAKRRRFKCTTCRSDAREAAAAEAEAQPPLEPTDEAQPAELTVFGAEEEVEQVEQVMEQEQASEAEEVEEVQEVVEKGETPAVEGEHQEPVEILFSTDESVVWAAAALEYQKRNKGKNKGAVSNGDVVRKRVRHANSDQTWRSQRQQRPVSRNVTHIGFPEQPTGGLQALPGDTSAAAMASTKTARKGKRRAASGPSAMEETLANIEAFPRGDGDSVWQLEEAVHRAVQPSGDRALGERAHVLEQCANRPRQSPENGWDSCDSLVRTGRGTPLCADECAGWIGVCGRRLPLQKSLGGACVGRRASGGRRQGGAGDRVPGSACDVPKGSHQPQPHPGDGEPPRAGVASHQNHANPTVYHVDSDAPSCEAPRVLDVCG
jgi:hypothetical protein